jgi:hypothetical protein
MLYYTIACSTVPDVEQGRLCGIKFFFPFLTLFFFFSLLFSSFLFFPSTRVCVPPVSLSFFLSRCVAQLRHPPGKSKKKKTNQTRSSPFCRCSKQAVKSAVPNAANIRCNAATLSCGHFWYLGVDGRVRALCYAAGIPA